VVVLPFQYGMSLEQTAQAIGLSKGWACRLRNQFIAGGAVGDKGKLVRAKTTGLAMQHEEGIFRPVIIRCSKLPYAFGVHYFTVSRAHHKISLKNA
jgi:hypothetical protein